MDAIFHFSLDPCASTKNAKCTKFYTIKENGLIQDWEGETVFVNPPFKKNYLWLKKCYEEGQKKGTVVVVIIPSRTDTLYFHEFCMKAHEIWFCKGRINFLLEGKKPKNGSTFALMIVIFKKTENKTPVIKSFYSSKKCVENSLRNKKRIDLWI